MNFTKQLIAGFAGFLGVFVAFSASSAFAGGGTTGPWICKNQPVRTFRTCQVLGVSQLNEKLIAAMTPHDRDMAQRLLRPGNSFSLLGCDAGLSHGVISAPGFGDNYPVNIANQSSQA